MAFNPENIMLAWARPPPAELWIEVFCQSCCAKASALETPLVSAPQHAQEPVVWCSQEAVVESQNHDMTESGHPSQLWDPVPGASTSGPPCLQS